jgi:hypothetical protein
MGRQVVVKAGLGAEGKREMHMDLLVITTFEATYGGKKKGFYFYFFDGWKEEDRNCKFLRFHLGERMGHHHARESSCGRKGHHTKIIRRQNPGRRSRGGGRGITSPGNRLLPFLQRRHVEAIIEKKEKQIVGVVRVEEEKPFTQIWEMIRDYPPIDTGLPT